ncbi:MULTISPECIES: LysR substrate-binding domain-containing protein [unclassified Agarivorans]|uniref:LysR substrate-binding domain-containing protein n=1 Tax=unclassified Agarivorans TaxID=2636026 RepID=UPI003D7E61A5
MSQQTLDLQALRSFVLGMELNNFALAAKRLHRSSSAVSAQLKKLEQQTGCPLVKKSGRQLLPTDSGEQLLSYARRLLALNDEAMAALVVPELTGKLHFAMQQDFSESFLTQVLGQFSRAYPQVQLCTSVTRNQQLVQGIEQGQYDLALAWDAGQSCANQQVLGALPLLWLSHPNLSLESLLRRRQALPLVMFEAPCLMREKASAALDKAGIPWKVVYSSQSLNGIWAAVEAGLGVTVRTSIGLPASLLAIDDLLPSLGNLGLLMHRTEGAEKPEVVRLGEIVRQQVVSRCLKLPA